MSVTLVANNCAGPRPASEPPVRVSEPTTPQQQIAAERLAGAALRIQRLTDRLSMTPEARAQGRQLIRDAAQALNELRRVL